jgi:Zn-dependent peptidase ImmA (M78 family)
MPSRNLKWDEAHSIAERQATLLLDLAGVSEPYVPQFIICNLPGLVVDWRPDWPHWGTSIETHDHWQIVIRSSSSKQRQRYSLAHELKHVLDRPVREQLWRHLPPEQRFDRSERLCNWFAACLLMPRAWIKRDWGNRIQDVHTLARRYFVSDEAMSTRLSELGLTSMTLASERRPRHPGAA